MCGIYGFNFDDIALAKRMDKVLSHRGPDGKGRISDKNITLGHRRLSIIDLSVRGKQPMANEDGSIWITYNGEIYNYLELRDELKKAGHKFYSDTDTEVIIHAYEEWGLRCLSKLNGMFAFCIFDQNKKELTLARDMIGIKPMYYYFNGKKFLFASEIKAILQDKSIKKVIDKKALNEYISLRYNPLEQTMFKGIKKILPGHFLRFDLKKKKLEKKSYWEIDKKEVIRSEAGFLKSLDKLFLDSIKRQMISDVPLGVFLSGGIDSTLVTSYMRKADADAKIKSFSVGFEEGDGVDERKYAKKASETLNTDHKEYLIPKDILKILPELVYSTDEPMADPALMPLYFLSKKSVKEVKVALTGDGGDELFFGYNHYGILKKGQKLSKIPMSTFLSKKAVDILPMTFFDRFYKHASEMDKEALQRISVFIKEVKTKNPKAYYELMSIFNDSERKKLLKEDSFQETDYNQIKQTYFKSADLLKNTLYFDTKRMLAESFLQKTDRMTMTNSQEARVPILDYRIVEFANKVPVKMRFEKKPLKKLLLNDFPKEFVYRKKQTFHVPLNRWFAKQKSLVKEYDITKNKYFDKEHVEKIIEKTKKGNLYSTKQYFNLVVFDMWEKRFMR